MNQVAGITIFVVFFSMVMIGGGIGQNFGPDRLEEYNITREDLQLSPDLPTVFRSEVDLDKDRVFSDNVSYVLTDNLTTPGYSEVSDDAIALDDGDPSGYAMYRIDSSTEYIETAVPYWGLLQPSHVSIEFYETTNTSKTPVSTSTLDGQQTFTLNGDENYMVFHFTDNPNGATPAVYDIQERRGEQLGFLELLTAYASSAANTIGAWFSLLTALPLFWVGVVITLIGTVIVLEIVLW